MPCPRICPDVITIDVSALNLSEAIHVRDIKLPEGVSAHADADLTVIRVSPPTVQEVETPAAAAAAVQPEVIKEKKTEEGEKK